MLSFGSTVSVELESMLRRVDQHRAWPLQWIVHELAQEQFELDALEKSQ
jgi:hypothetical protein